MFKDLYKFSDWNDVTEHQKIGEILLSAGKINLIHLSMALDAQRFQKMPLGVMFILFKVITKDDLEQALLAQRYIDDRIASGASWLFFPLRSTNPTTTRSNPAAVNTRIGQMS